MELHRNLKPWPPGQWKSEREALGSRTVFSQGFLKDLGEVWATHGKQTMISTAQTNPAVFFATCARLLPNDVRVTVEQSLPGNLSMEDWQTMKEVIAAVRQALPDAADRRPGAVLEHVLSALRWADAKLIVERTGPLTMWRPHPAQGYCLTLREEMPATAIIMLAPINASSRTMSGGIPMSSRAISASNSAVATAAINPRITSTVRFIW